MPKMGQKVGLPEGAASLLPNGLLAKLHWTSSKGLDEALAAIDVTAAASHSG
jgi:hypothetical protein